MSAWATMLDRLVRERGPALFGYAYVLAGDRDHAEDLLQDALVRTFRSGRALGSLDSAHAYVKRAITTAFVDSGRRAKARPLAAGVDVRDRPDLARVPDPSGAVDDALDLRAALLTLAPRERACVVLRYLEDMTVAGVASTLGLAEGTVKRYLSDGVARLREAAPGVDFTEIETAPVHPQGGAR
ncbi:sigma-70 family RNA polymerase sigma factor [Demequina soli]|uniref:sigma-70 family RNA polymerase sigma factor n=1 Tax=Demequina soli TaxID=1638987 RepID=UPI0007820FC7|nr:sigma-70 family RNA polymerase sigma factor [Demequina soli]